MRKASYASKVVHLLSQLHTKYPTYNIARHLATALSDYGDYWGMSDKELLFALEKYEVTLDMDITPLEDSTYVDKIVKDAMNLDTILNDPEEEDY